MTKTLRTVYLLILAVSLVFTLALLMRFATGHHHGVEVSSLETTVQLIALLIFGSMTATGIATCREFRLPCGFLLVVVGAFFLGSGTRTVAAGGEVDVAFGLSCALAGYLLIYYRAKNVYIEVFGRSTEAQRRETMERLAEARIEPAHRTFRASPLPLPLP